MFRGEVTPKLLADYKKAIQERDLPKLAEVVDLMRDLHEMSYGTCFAFAKVLTEISNDDWQELVREAESLNKW